jgi:glutamine amidotransferase
MCRLYGLRSTHVTQVGCELIEAQNSLIRQSLEDMRGLANPHGWGIGYWADGIVHCKRQVGPAAESEDFRNHARDLRAPAILAHVRRATVGTPREVNTHPFTSKEGLLAHNGHIDHFDRIRPLMLEEMTEEARHSILGETDSEHIFQLLRSHRTRHPDWSMRETLRRTIHQIVEWACEIDDEAEVAINTLWIEDGHLAGSRFGRSLWYIERDEPHRCEICGELHAHPEPGEPYHVVELASERLTSEDWQEVPRDCVFEVDDDRTIESESLDVVSRMGE